MGDYARALENARRALREALNGFTIHHRNALPEAYLATADILAELRGYEHEAIEYYSGFLQNSARPMGIDVTWSAVHAQIGFLSLRLKQYQQAILAFEKALEINPYYPWEVDLFYQIAHCYYRLRAFEQTLRTLEQVLKKSHAEQTPITDWRIYNLQGHAYFALEQYAKAKLAYATAIRLAPASAKGLETTYHYWQSASARS